MPGLKHHPSYQLEAPEKKAEQSQKPCKIFIPGVADLNAFPLKQAE